MIARGFKSVIWVATVGTAALGCYMVSLRVATERNELAKVERQIVEARREIRSLQTELGTRGRMTQLEQWNAEVLALSAPSSQQFLKDEFTLARLYRSDPTMTERSAEVRLASAEVPSAPSAEPVKAGAPAVVRIVAEPAEPAAPLLHRASFTPDEAAAKPKPPSAKPVQRSVERTATASMVKPAPKRDGPASNPAKPQPRRTAAASAAKPEAPATGNAARPKPAMIASKAVAKPVTTAAKPASKPTTVAAKPVREAASAVRPTKGKGAGGN